MHVTFRNGLTVIFFLALTAMSYGETTVWLSDDATFSDLDIITAAPVGSTGSFDIWIKSDQSYKLYNVSLDLQATGEAIEFTGADIVIGQHRFRLQSNPLVTHDGAMISDMSAYAGIGGANFGTGISPEVPVDDETLGAYRFATIHYRVSNLGVSELRLKVGASGFGWWIVDTDRLRLGVDDAVIENVPGATDMIPDGRVKVVPEPSGLVLLLISGWLLSMRRPSRLRL